MAQIEIYNFLKAQRDSGNEEYFSPKQIKKATGLSVTWLALVQLENFGYLDVKLTGKFRDHIRTYRLKK